MEISDEEREELEWVARHGEPAYVRPKALALLNLADGCPVKEVARMFRRSRQALYDWRKRFAEEGVRSLWVRPGRGRKPKADLDELERYVRQSPRRFGIERTRWTLATLAQVVPSVRGFSAYGVQKALARAGIRYKRGQPSLHSPDPDCEQKQVLPSSWWVRPDIVGALPPHPQDSSHCSHRSPRGPPSATQPGHLLSLFSADCGGPNAVNPRGSGGQVPQRLAGSVRCRALSWPLARRGPTTNSEEPRKRGSGPSVEASP